MKPFGETLQKLARHGPSLLIVALVVGWSLGPQVSSLKAALPLAAFLLTLGSFVAAALSPREFDFADPEGLVLALAWIVAAIPCVAVSTLSVVDIDQNFKFGLLIALIAPPIGSAAALSAILKLRPQLALALSVGPTLIAPLTVPFFLSLAGTPLAHGIMPLIVTLAAIVGAAALCTYAVLCNRSRLDAALPDAGAAGGISIIGLMLVGVIAASQARVAFTSDAAFLHMIGLAFALNLALFALGALTFWIWGAKEALTVGLVTGNRNVTLAWAIAGAALPSMAETFVIAAVLPILAFPLVIKLILHASEVSALLQRPLSPGSYWLKPYTFATRENARVPESARA